MMFLKLEFIAPYAPRLKKENIPAEFQVIASSVERNLDDMRRATAALIAAIALFEFCGTQEAELIKSQNSTGRSLFGDWKFLAGREGAMAIRNFRFALSTVRGLIGKIPTWSGSIDSASLKQAEKEFSEYFPFADHMRHAVAHPEIHSNPDKVKPITGGFDSYGIKIEKGSPFVINNSIINNTFAHTFEGAFVHYDLTEETIIKILGILNICFSAFSNISAIRFL